MVKKIFAFVVISYISCFSSLSLADLPSIDDDDENLATRSEVYVDRYIFEGNHVISTQQLNELTRHFQQRNLSTDELLEVTRLITKFYIDRGYINSGALLPDQSIKNGLVNIHIIEGRLTDLDIEGLERLNETYLRSRLERALAKHESTLNIIELRETLKLMEESPVLDSVKAQLSPGLNRGESELKIKVAEANPYRINYQFDNHRSPSVGSFHHKVTLSHLNLSGHADALTMAYDMTDGSGNYSMDYALPISSDNSSIAVSYSQSDSVVVEAPFNSLDFKSKTESMALSFTKPIIDTSARKFSLSLKLSKTTTETFLLGIPFAFPPGVAVAKITELSFSQDWVERSLDSVLAINSSFNLGLKAFESTQRDGSEPDSDFFSWRTQLQWIKRHEFLDSETLLKVDFQLSNHALLSNNKLAIGGASTVRGYRENVMVRDNGIVTSLEWRIPTITLPIAGLSQTDMDGMLYLAPFVDYGYGSNNDSGTSEPWDIASMGMGLRWSPHKKIHTQFYWAKAFRNFPDSNEYDLQDDGIHFSISVDL